MRDSLILQNKNVYYILVLLYYGIYDVQISNYKFTSKKNDTLLIYWREKIVTYCHYKDVLLMILLQSM